MNKKLTEEEIEEIVTELKGREYWGQISMLAKKYKVTKGRISQIKGSI